MKYFDAPKLDDWPECLKEFVGDVNPRDAYAIFLRFGLWSDPMTIRGIGEKLGIQGTGADALIRRGLMKIRKRIIIQIITENLGKCPLTRVSSFIEI